MLFSAKIQAAGFPMPHIFGVANLIEMSSESAWLPPAPAAIRSRPPAEGSPGELL